MGILNPLVKRETGKIPLELHKPVSGFTMLELLLVMALIAFLGLATLPMIMGYSDMVQLRLAAEEVANEMRLAQSIAQAHGRNTRLTIYKETKKIAISYDNDLAKKEIKEAFYLPPGVSFDAASDTQLSFTSLGGVYYTGIINGDAWNTTLVAANGERYYVIVAVNSGRVRTSRTR